MLLELSLFEGESRHCHDCTYRRCAYVVGRTVYSLCKLVQHFWGLCKHYIIYSSHLLSLILFILHLGDRTEGSFKLYKKGQCSAQKRGGNGLLGTKFTGTSWNSELQDDIQQREAAKIRFGADQRFASAARSVRRGARCGWPSDTRPPPRPRRMLQLLPRHVHIRNGGKSPT